VHLKLLAAHMADRGSGVHKKLFKINYISRNMLHRPLGYAKKVKISLTL
jgi:hypothetical protein